MGASTPGPGRGRNSDTVLMRKAGGLALLLMALFKAQPSFAQKLTPYEPPMMDPYSTVYVNASFCSAGKVLKVQGTPRNQRRKKSCVRTSDLQGARAPAPPSSQIRKTARYGFRSRQRKVQLPASAPCQFGWASQPCLMP